MPSGNTAATTGIIWQANRAQHRKFVFRDFDLGVAKVHLLMDRVTDKNDVAKGWMTETDETGWWEGELELGFETARSIRIRTFCGTAEEVVSRGLQLTTSKRYKEF